MEKVKQENCINTCPYQNVRSYEEEVDLRELMAVIWMYRKLIVAVFLGAIFTAAVVVNVIRPTYELSSVIAVGRFDSPLYNNVNNVKQIIESDDFLRKALNEAGINLNESEFVAFKKSLKVTPVKDTNVIKITLATTNPEEGKLIVQKVVELVTRQGESEYIKKKELLEQQKNTNQTLIASIEHEIDRLKKLIEAFDASQGPQADFRKSQTIEILRVYEQQKMALLDKSYGLEKELNSLLPMTVVSPVYDPAVPAKPNKKVVISVSAFLGLMAGVFLAFMVNYFRKEKTNLSQITGSPGN